MDCISFTQPGTFGRLGWFEIIVKMFFKKLFGRNHASYEL